MTKMTGTYTDPLARRPDLLGKVATLEESFPGSFHVFATFETDAGTVSFMMKRTAFHIPECHDKEV